MAGRSGGRAGAAEPLGGSYGPGAGTRGGARGTAVRAHRPWSTVMLALHVGGLLLGVAGLLTGVVAVMIDMTERTDAWDGFVAAIGIALGVVSLVVAVVYGLLTRFTLSGRARADAGDPRPLHRAAIASIVVAVAGWLLVALAIYPWLLEGVGAVALVAFLTLLPATLALAAAVRTAQLTRA